MKTKITVISAPKDYDHPPDAKLRIFAIGDVVLTPYDEICTIVEFVDGYRNRADEWVDMPVYMVDSKLPGSPVVWFLGWQLKRLGRRSED